MLVRGLANLGKKFEDEAKPGTLTFTSPSLRSYSVILVVISGLPGLGKSFFFNQLSRVLSGGNHEALAHRMCIVQKDEISLGLKAESKHARPKQKDILDVIMDRFETVVAAGIQQPHYDEAQPFVLAFNMNINTNWSSCPILLFAFQT